VCEICIQFAVNELRGYSFDCDNDYFCSVKFSFNLT